MNKEFFLYLSIGFLLGVLTTVLVASNAISAKNEQAMRILGITEQDYSVQEEFDAEQEYESEELDEELDRF